MIKDIKHLEDVKAEGEFANIPEEELTEENLWDQDDLPQQPHSSLRKNNSNLGLVSPPQTLADRGWLM